MRGASPCGCSESRSALSGGSSSAGAAPAISGGTARLYETRFQCAVDGERGAGLVRGEHMLDRRAPLSSSSSGRSPYIGA